MKSRSLGCILKPLTKHPGFTLTEILIALCLGSILITLSIQLFLSVKQINQYQQGIARIQENMQTASILLGQWIRSAGDYGCNRMDAHRVLNIIGNIDANHLGINKSQSIQPLSINFLVGNPYFSNYALSRYKMGTDLLWIKRVSRFYPLNDYTEATDGTVKVIGNPRYRKGDILFLSDCQHIDVAMVTQDVNTPLPRLETTIHINTNTDSSESKLSKRYSPSASLGKFESIIFYIADTLRKNQRGHSIYALFSTDMNGRTLELIEGVEAMQISVCCQPAEPTELKETSVCYQSEHWQTECLIQSVQVDLLLTSVEDVLQAPLEYTMNQLKVKPQDRILRKWWSEQWAVRSAIQ